MLKYFLVLLLGLNGTALFAQNFETVEDSQVLWGVKQINQFIERFNNQDTILSKQYYKDDPSAREKLIGRLFNAEKRDWNIEEVQSFIKYANDKKTPRYLDFFADDWCAKINCAVVWKEKPENVVLTLKLQRLPNNTYKWIITKAEAGFLKAITTAIPSPNAVPFRMPAAIDSTTSLNPMSHATDFMSIKKISTDKINIANYFQDPDKLSAETQQFAQECLNGHLLIKNTTFIMYDFVQIKGWEIEIQQYNRATNNSGWLISKLTKTPPDQTNN